LRSAAPVRRSARARLVAAGLVLAISGCTSTAGGTPAPPVLRWRQVDLPAAPHGRDVVRAATACDGRWYVAGTILDQEGNTRPALWASSDGTSFTAVPIKPRSVYGPSDVLLSVACRGADVVAIGAKNGGAHGNPRPSTWISTAGGPLTEVVATFEQYGGESQLGLGPVAGGPVGYLIVGSRIDRAGGPGAAVWQSPDGRAFTLVDADPALESGPAGQTEVNGAAVLASGYVAVGDLIPPGSKLASRQPLVWASPDGRTWHRTALLSSPRDAAMMQVAPLDGSLVSVGLDGSTYAAWSGAAGTWSQTARFGALVAGSELPSVPSLVTAGGAAYAVVSDGSTYGLWRGRGARDWIQLVLPVSTQASPDGTTPRVVVAAAAGRTVMIAADDGTRASLWFTET
jgi:hypothetical protein